MLGEVRLGLCKIKHESFRLYTSGLTRLVILIALITFSSAIYGGNHTVKGIND